MSLVRTSLVWERGPPGAWPVPHYASRKIPVRPPQRCLTAVRATSTVGLASGPPGGRRTASTLDRATPLVCHTGHGPGQSSRRQYPGSDAGQTRGRHVMHRHGAGHSPCAHSDALPARPPQMSRRVSRRIARRVPDRRTGQVGGDNARCGIAGRRLTGSRFGRARIAGRRTRDRPFELSPRTPFGSFPFDA